MEKAIKKAIEGGYRKLDMFDCNYGILLDPLFWQALGKAENWQEEWRDKAITAMIEPRWRYEWYAFIDHLIAGKDIESFFNNLLK